MKLLLPLTAVALLAGCGGDDGEPAARRTPPAEVTPIPSDEAPPSPAPGIHEGDDTPTPAPSLRATPAPEDEGGDEAGTRVPVRVRVGRTRIRASDDVVPSFFKLRFRIASRLDRRVRVVVVRSGAGGSTLGRVSVPAGGRATIDVEGQRTGSLEVLSPDLDPDMTAILAVQPGAG
jgi:hypothetical protein